MTEGLRANVRERGGRGGASWLYVKVVMCVTARTIDIAVWTGVE